MTEQVECWRLRDRADRMTDSSTQRNGDAGPARLLLPVPGLRLNQQWDVGHVRFHPAGAAAGLIEASHTPDVRDAPGWVRSLITKAAAYLDSWAAADLTVPGDIDDALPVADAAVSVLRAVQHMECPMGDIRHQSFGLPGDAISAVISYVNLTAGAVPAWRRTGALAGWAFSDDSFTRWNTDPAYRFLHEALLQPAETRTVRSGGR